jgi:hypothetical protein
MSIKKEKTVNLSNLTPEEVRNRVDRLNNNKEKLAKVLSNIEEKTERVLKEKFYQSPAKEREERELLGKPFEIVR